MSTQPEFLREIVGVYNPQFVEDASSMLQTEMLSPTRAIVKCLLPVSHAMLKPEPFILDVQSEKGVYLEPFRLVDTLPEKANHTVGFVTISLGEQRLVLISSEYPLYGIDNEYLGVVPHSYLLKTDPNDPNILVQPILQEHQGVPYILMNNYEGRKGLGLYEPHKLEITEKDGEVLINRVYRQR